MTDISIHNEVSTTTDRAEAAYYASLSEIHAVPESELLSITLDSVSVTTSMFGILPKLRAMRDSIASAWRNFDLEAFDKLEQYGLALAHAQGIYNRLSAPKVNVTEAVAELTLLRDLLFDVATPLVKLGLIGREEVDKCKVDVGYRPLIEDVFTLVGLYRDHWTALEGKVVLTQEQLLKAKNLAIALMEQLGVKEQSPSSVGEAALIRQKAFTLFIRTYENARRAVVYLRRAKGDADGIAPSFYSLRAGKRRSSDEAPAANENGSSGETPKPPSAAPASSIVIDNPAGLPIDHPFSN